MLEETAELENILDHLIARLSQPGGTKATKALLVDARRLRAVVGNWRTIVPTGAALSEMAQRIANLARSVDAALPREPAAPSAPPTYEPVVTGPPPAVPERSTGLGHGEPVRARTLPDLDISDVAHLLDDGSFRRIETEVGLHPVARPDASRQRAAEAASRGRSGLDGAGGAAVRSSTPPQGRRRVDGSSAVEDRPRGERPSRFLHDEDEHAGPAYDKRAPAQERPGLAFSEDATPARPSPRPAARQSSAPPPAQHSDKTQIAVRPLRAPEVPDKRLIMLTEPYSERADAYRALRRKLSGPGAPKTIAVTSAEPGEGKTSCAVNLALAFRETSSEKVLLVEANLRAPALAKLFGFEPPACFAKQMAKNRDGSRASWTVVEQFEPLHVLAVDPSSKTAPILDPVAFANALEQLVEAGYAHIIIDTPPALSGSDMNVIADTVDGIVVVAWIKKSKRSLVKKAIEQLKPATILGVVTLDG